MTQVVSQEFKLGLARYIHSNDGRFIFALRPDGELVVEGPGGILWSAGVAGKGGAFAVIQDDGNLVLYNAAHQPVWSSGTGGNSGVQLSVQSDGNVVIYDQSGNPIWSTNTGGFAPVHFIRKSQLKTGESLALGQFLRSGNRRFFLALEPDGNLVLYSPGYRIHWQSKTGGKGAALCRVEPDGELVLFDSDSRRVWGTGVKGGLHPHFVLQDDGNAVMYDSGGVVIWASNSPKSRR